MAIANPASPQVGPEPESHNEPKGQPESSKIDAGVSLEATPAVAGPTIPEDSISAGAEEVTGAESSASHLAGLAASDIRTIDNKFQKLLETVHENRPGDDLAIIRRAWGFFFGVL